MNHLIIYSHPNPASFNHALLEVLERTLRGKGHDVRVRDLYQLAFDPVLSGQDLKALQDGTKIASSVLTEQEHVRWADQLTFIYPIWWTRMPAITCGYIDRVFSKGFAYDYGPTGLQKLLTGKKAYLVSTFGAPLSAVESSGAMAAMNKINEQETFQFCGIELIGHQYFGSVPTVTDGERKKMLEEITRIAASWPVRAK